MKSRIILLTIIIGILVGIGLTYQTSTFSVHSSSVNYYNPDVPLKTPSSSPEKTISEFISYAKAGKTAELRDFMTEIPDSYISCTYSEISSASLKSRKLQGGDDSNSSFEVSSEEINETKNLISPLFKTILEDFSANINYQQLILEKIIDKQEKNNDARYRVLLRSDLNTNYYRKIFIFLHREDQTWKIFHVSEFDFDSKFPY